MPTQYATVVSFNPNRGWGFAEIDHTNKVTCLFHVNQKKRVTGTGFAKTDKRNRGLNDSPKPGDKLVVSLLKKPNGFLAADYWAFRLEWDGVYDIEGEKLLRDQREAAKRIYRETASPVEVVSHVAENETSPTYEAPPIPTTAIQMEPPEPVTEKPFTVDELFEVFNDPFLHAILDSVRDGEITVNTLRTFARNTPSGKHGDNLWRMYQKWTPQNIKEKKTVAGFMRNTLEAAGFIV